MIETDLSKSTIGIDLISVLCSLDLHLAFELLSELEHVSFLCHDLVCECSTSNHWFIVLLHVESDEIGAFLLDAL